MQDRLETIFHRLQDEQNRVSTSGKTYRFVLENEDEDGEIDVDNDSPKRVLIGIPRPMKCEDLYVDVTEECSFRIGAVVPLDPITYQWCEIYERSDNKYIRIR